MKKRFSQPDYPPAPGGFSLVEVTIAIGIFAFVVVGILGLLPAGMRMRAEAAADTRGVLIAEELFAAVRSAPSLTNVVVRDSPAMLPANNQAIDLLQSSVVIGYPAQTTVPFFLWGGDRASAGTPDSAWVQGQMPPGAVDNAIDVLARLRVITNTVAAPMPTNLARVTVEVRSPANLPLANTRPVVFTTLVPLR